MDYRRAFKSDAGKKEILSIYDKFLDQWNFNYKTFYINTSYGKIHIINSGDNKKPSIILLHGTSSNSLSWMDEIKEFSNHYCVYAIDIIGEPGKSDEKQYPFKNPANFLWLDEVLNKLNLCNVSIVGISLGAWIAIGYSIMHPEKIDKLVLLCPSGIGKQKISFIFKAIPLMLLGDYGYNKITKLVNGNQSIDKEVEDYTKLIAKNFNLRFDKIPIFSDAELKKLTMPTLLYVGEKDVLINSHQTAKRFEKMLPNVSLNLLSDYGHVLIGFKKEILNFLLK